MKEVLLKCRPREEVGKKGSHKVRAAGEIPAILYGHKKENIAMSVPSHDLWHILHNATSEQIIIHLEIEGSSEGKITSLLKDVQHHPVTGEILHVDFQRISKDEFIKVNVPITLTGVAKGVKEFGGILDHGVRQIGVRCKPLEIPETLEIDVSALEIGDSIYVSALMEKYPHLDILNDPHVTIAHVSPPKKLELTAKEEEEAAAKEEEEAAAKEEAAEEEEGKES